MKKETIIHDLQCVMPDESDLIVLNGGEPTIHPEFYELLDEIQERFDSEIAVYTNGSILDFSRLKLSKRIFFVIPIHGMEETHDSFTRRPGSYQRTCENVYFLDKRHFRYRLKFIVNNEMIFSKFDILRFLQEKGIMPEEVIIARLNETAKSVSNGVTLPPDNQMKKYVNEQLRRLSGMCKIKLLDFPPCDINDQGEIMGSELDAPQFYFNDPDHAMKTCSYYKEIPQNSRCEKCSQQKMCDLLRNSYLTTVVTHDALKLERE